MLEITKKGISDHTDLDNIGSNTHASIDTALALDASHRSGVVMTHPVIEQNIMLNAFRLAVQGSLSIQKMVDGFIDEYEDETGVDTAGSTNETYDSTNDLYSPSGEMGIDAYTKLMLHCDGADGSTVFTDSETTPKTVTVNGNAQIDTAQSVFGGASGLFDGIGDCLSLADSEDFNFGSGDFTIDVRVRSSNIGAFQGIYGHLGTVSLFLAIYNSKIGIWASSNGSSWDIFDTIAWTSTLSQNTWYHIALVRNGSSWKGYVNGVQDWSTTSAATLFNSTAVVDIGSYGNAQFFFNGWMDEYRVSKGIARWTAGFTPPTSAYSTTKDNMTLLSAVQVAESTPTNARIVLFEEDTDVVTINTDLKCFVSRDNGTTYTQATISDEGDYDTNKRILTGTADLSAQPSGANMKYKVETLNNKNLKLHGTALLWQ